MLRFFALTLPRLALGALFLLSAVDGFYFLATGQNFIHPPKTPQAVQFEAGLIASGFLWPLLKMVNLVGGLSLLANRAPAFGLALLLPIVTVIIGFHLFLNPQGLPVAVLLAVCSLLLIRAYWGQYRALFACPAERAA